ncbi:hypothetical protein BGL57_00075 [Helicobacter pylori]|nr:hypothetical protein BGL57_00075 [Helicobacter pylori]
MVYFKGGKRFLGWLRLRVLKRVGCRILSRLIVAIWGKSK